MKSAPVFVECANDVPHAGTMQTEENINYIFRTTRPTEDSLTVTWYLAPSNRD